MIRVTFRKTEHYKEQAEYPTANGAMPFAGVLGMTAIIRTSEDPHQPHEVVAILSTQDITNIENIEEVSHEGQSEVR